MGFVAHCCVCDKYYFGSHVYFYMVRVHRTKENGQERVEIEEDGVLKTVLINGKSSLTMT